MTDVSLGPATACIRAEAVMRTQLAAVASTINGELAGSYEWVQAVKDESIETVADHAQPPLDWPAIRFIPNAPVHTQQVAGREKVQWDLILVALVQQHDREDLDTERTIQRSMAIRAMLLCRAAEIVLRTPSTGLVGTTGVYQMHVKSAGFVRPFPDANTLGFERVLTVQQFVHDPF